MSRWPFWPGHQSRPTQPSSGWRARGPALCAAQRPRSLFFLLLSSWATGGFRPEKRNRAQVTRVPGRNLGLGRELANPPGLNLAQFGGSESDPSIWIRRLRAKIGGYKSPSRPAPSNPSSFCFPFSLSALFLPAQRRRGSTRLVGGHGGHGAGGGAAGTVPAATLLPLSLVLSATIPQKRVAVACGRPLRLDPRKKWSSATAAPLAGARVRPEPRAAPSSGPAVASLAAWISVFFFLSVLGLGFGLSVIFLSRSGSTN